MRKKLLVNLVVIMILSAGLVTIMNLNREAIPEVNFDMVTITTIYPGAAPDELESLVTVPIEKKLREVDNLDKVRSYNIENVSVIAIYIEDKARDKKQVVQDIKDAVESVTDLPANAEAPVVEEIKTDKTQVIDIALFGKRPGVPYGKIRESADALEDFLLEIDGVAEVEFFGFYDREYIVEVNPVKLKFYRLGINRVINSIKTRNIDLPGGTIKVGKNEYVLRTKGQYRNAEEVADTVLMSNDAGFVTRIKDIATVKDAYEEADIHERFNGRKAVVMRIWKKRSADEIKLVQKLKSGIAGYSLVHAKDVDLSIFSDFSRYTMNSIDSVISNAITGSILLALILLVLLGFRISLIVAVSIPLSFMVAFMGMGMSDITINVISLFGMIMVLGMIVDFSIVVADNAHRYMQMGHHKFNAIKKGVLEVVAPVTVTLLCISAAFTPLLLLSGIMGKFLKAIPMVIIICLFASWIIAMFILPTFLNMFAKDECSDEAACVDDLAEVIDKGAFGTVQRGYKKLLVTAMNHRYFTLGILVAMLVGALALSNVVGFVFMTGGGAEQLKMKIKLPMGTNLNTTLQEMKKLEKILMKIPKEERNGIRGSIGKEESDGLDPRPGDGTHKATYNIYLVPEKDRSRTAYEIDAQLRRDVAEAKKKRILRKDMHVVFSVEERQPPVGRPVNIEIRGDDFRVMEKIAAEYIKELKSMKGVRDIDLDYERGKQEYRYFIKEVMAAQTGVSAYDVAISLNASYQGAVATNVKEGDEDIDIRVRFPEYSRKRLYSLNNVMIANNRGGLIPLSTVTGVKKQPGVSQISRLNFKRIVQVKADVDTDIITSQKANMQLMKKFADIEKRYPGYSVAYAGEQEDTSENMKELGTYFAFALAFIFIVLAVFMNSLILPLVVMIAIPFSMVGVVLALFVHGEPMSFMSTLGIFSLAGVIVSNTLVLVQFINNQRDLRHPLKESLLRAGVMRLRPVLLTTGTTVLALFPTIYGFGGKDYMVGPLALSFGYGLIFATFITLVLIPTFYYIAEDVKGAVARILAPLGIKMNPAIYEGAIESSTFEAVSGSSHLMSEPGDGAEGEVDAPREEEPFTGIGVPSEKKGTGKTVKKKVAKKRVRKKQ